MKLQIEIPEKTYQKIIEGAYDYGDMNVIIQHGIPPESRPHGEWKSLANDNRPLDLRSECSVCGEINEPRTSWNFCPNCGASMEKERR